jgi:uroporphyrinogen decarboxylase
MREVPLEANPQAVDFARRLIAGEIPIVIFMTGVGFRHLLAAVESHIDRGAFLGALGRVMTVARGPKPVAAMKEVGLSPTLRVPEPNTWREVLSTLDAEVSLAGETVGLQEYGEPNPALVAGLQARGARPIAIQVYRWDFPADTGPLRDNLQALAAGQRDVALFTSAHQVANVMLLAQQLGLEQDVRQALRKIAVASIGPTTSEMLQEQGLPVDIEPEHSKMGHLVSAAAQSAAAILAQRRGPPPPRMEVAAGGQPPAESLPAPLPSAKPDANHGLAPHPSESGPFMRACRRLPTEITPIWLMRQAGRYLPEYRAVREKMTFLEFCKNPQLCAEVMVRTVERLGVDAAIIFSDLLPILEPLGMELEFAAGEGPVIHNPLRAPADVDRVAELESIDALEFVMQTVRATRAMLPQHIPLIGFAGAPFTLASYMIEGGGSHNYLHTKTLMYRDEGAWRALLSRLGRAIARYINGQIAAGAQCVQLFDSWVGCLHPDDYRRYVLPFSQAVLREIPPGTPVIHFATGNPALLPLLAEAGGDVIGLDWRVRLDDAWRAVGDDRGVQGNLDPAMLLAEPSQTRRRAQEILDQAAGRPGHIFNLGHGVLPPTPPENVIALVNAVHELSQRP